jgi:HEAT repeats
MSLRFHFLLAVGCTCLSAGFGVVEMPICGAAIASSNRTNSASWVIAASPSPAAKPVASPAAVKPASTPAQQWFWWVLIPCIPLAALGGVVYGIRSRQAAAKTQPQVSAPLQQLPDTPTAPTENLALQVNPPLAATSRLARVDIVEALMTDLHSPDPSDRRKAIWELGQRGDSRSVQPLVDLLMDADSQQRSLILAALSEIGLRTLTPMNRALMMSIQDDSPDVRKNAIRDVTRLCDVVAQISQLLQYAASDTDSEVRDTAQWALTQLDRIRSLPKQDD